MVENARPQAGEFHVVHFREGDADVEMQANYSYVFSQLTKQSGGLYETPLSSMAAADRMQPDRRGPRRALPDPIRHPRRTGEAKTRGGGGPTRREDARDHVPGRGDEATSSHWWRSPRRSDVASGGSEVRAQQPTFGVGIEVINLNVSVTDGRNRYVTDLTQSDFSIFEDGVKQKVTLFTHENLPISLVLMLDTSASMDEKIETAQQAAIRFVGTLKDTDRAQIVQFNDRATVLQDFTSETALLEDCHPPHRDLRSRRRSTTPSTSPSRTSRSRRRRPVSCGGARS